MPVTSIPSSNHPVHAIWAVVPAAGIGKRMQSSIPKQYLPLNGRPVIEHTLQTLLKSKYIKGLVLALQSDDEYWQQVDIGDSGKPVLIAAGGSERANSVLNALTLLMQSADYSAEDWVMVHDAVRPCLRLSDIEKLALEVNSDSGALLALPVRDTMKRQHASDASVQSTVPREQLWHALTPQYFPAERLQNALQQALENSRSITDESSAMELAGYSPQLVVGNEDNIKITRPDDLRLASLYLQSQSIEEQA